MASFNFKNIASSLGLKNNEENEEVKKQKNMINDLRQKRETLIKSLDIDIKSIEKQILSVYEEIGKNIYDLSMQGKQNVDILDFSNQIDVLKEHNSSINQIKEKKEQINERYGEEIQMLERFLVNMSIEKQENNSENRCPKCNNIKNDGDLFCTSCGHRY